MKRLSDVSIILWAVTTIHAYWAVVLTLDGSARHITAMGTISSWLPHPLADSALYASVTIMAIASLMGWVRSPLWSFVMVMPQQATLVVSAAGAIACMARQHYADGVPRPFGFISADQMPWVLMAGWHTLAVLIRHRGWRNGE